MTNPPISAPESASTLLPSPRRGPTAGTLFLGIVLFGIFAVVALQLIRNNVHAVTSGPAPDFSMTLYTGGDFMLSEQRGQWVVVNFWGSWCGPCRDEAPELEAMWQKYQTQGVVIVGVGFRDVESAARQFISENGITYPNGNDDGLRVTAHYGVTGAPETYVVDPDGNVQAVMLGPLPLGWLDKTLTDLMAEREAKS